MRLAQRAQGAYIAAGVLDAIACLLLAFSVVQRLEILHPELHPPWHRTVVSTSSTCTRSDMQGTDFHTHFNHAYIIMVPMHGTQNGKNVMDHQTLQSAGSSNPAQAKVQ